MAVYCPSEEIPDDPYAIVLWSDFTSDDFEVPFEANQVVTVHSGGEIEMLADYPVDFYDN